MTFSLWKVRNHSRVAPQKPAVWVKKPENDFFLQNFRNRSLNGTWSHLFWGHEQNFLTTIDACDNWNKRIYQTHLRFTKKLRFFNKNRNRQTVSWSKTEQATSPEKTGRKRPEFLGLFVQKLWRLDCRNLGFHQGLGRSLLPLELFLPFQNNNLQIAVRAESIVFVFLGAQRSINFCSKKPFSVNFWTIKTVTGRSTDLKKTQKVPALFSNFKTNFKSRNAQKILALAF